MINDKNSEKNKIFVSLGSNCCITWWLNKLELRERAYPFDWTSLTIKHLNTILKNNFYEYSETIKINFLSDKHLDYNGNPSMVLSNKYNIKFAHEVLNKDIDNFKKSVKRRIERFNNLKNKNFITFIRIELSIKKSGYINELKELIKLLDLINPNYVIKLIIHKDSIQINLDKIQVYYFDSFNPNWKMKHLDWTFILTGSSKS